MVTGFVVVMETGHIVFRITELSGGSFTTSETTNSIGGCVPVVVGCMNPNANNYNQSNTRRLWGNW